ncbi:MAG TPA: hypothetical protein VMW10_02185 [Alphaproteobacteria bacterium]|nr:hypothetical protein [Alphaproteobacteria bacterium]
MDHNDLRQNEFENDIQRFMQIRDQVHEEIKKIGSHVATLDETNKRFVAHFDVFKKMSEDAEIQMKSVIKAAAHDMARASAKEFSPLFEGIVRNLDKSVLNAKKVLEETMGEKYLKLVLFSCLGCILFGIAGFGGGYFYSKQYTYALPNNFIEIYTLGLGAKVDSLKKTVQEKERKRGVKK